MIRVLVICLVVSLYYIDDIITCAGKLKVIGLTISAGGATGGHEQDAKSGGRKKDQTRQDYYIVIFLYHGHIK